MGSARVEFAKLISTVRTITLDTCSYIYYLHRDASRGPLVYQIVRRAAGGGLSVHLPGIVRLELLVHPFQTADVREMEMVRSLIDDQAGVEPIEMSEDVLRTAAEIRALTRLKTPDALVVGSAVVSGSEVIVGNDRRFDVLNAVPDVKLFVIGNRPRSMPRYLHLDDFVDDGDPHGAKVEERHG